jgi:hypothetical protein
MKFSVIVPAYNSEAFLGETLDSLRAQTFQSWEAVVVNDGSADGTQAVIDAYRAKDARIRCIAQENAGVSAARNRGLQEATGDYVLFLDADDLFDPCALAAFAERIEQTGADLLLGRLRFFENGNPGSFHAAAQELSCCQTVKTFDRRLLWNFLVCNKCYRRALLQAHNVRFPACGFSEEGAFFMDAVFTGATIAGAPDSVALYRRHTAAEGASVSQTANEKNIRSLAISMQHIYAAAEAALHRAQRTDEDYLQEILYKHLHILVSQFYRSLWQMDDAALTLCISQIKTLLDRSPEARIAAICKANPDLRLTKLRRAEEDSRHAAIAAHPIVSVCVSRACCEQAARALFSQTCPLFELLLTPQAAKALPQELLSKPNVRVAPRFSPNSGCRLRFAVLPVLDKGTLQTLLRIPLPKTGAAAHVLSLLLKRRHRR